MYEYVLCFSRDISCFPFTLRRFTARAGGRWEKREARISPSRRVAGLYSVVCNYYINKPPCLGKTRTGSTRRTVQCHAMCTKKSRGNVRAEVIPCIIRPAGRPFCGEHLLSALLRRVDDGPKLAQAVATYGRRGESVMACGNLRGWPHGSPVALVDRRTGGRIRACDRVRVRARDVDGRPPCFRERRCPIAPGS